MLSLETPQKEIYQINLRMTQQEYEFWEAIAARFHQGKILKDNKVLSLVKWNMNLLKKDLLAEAQKRDEEDAIIRKKQEEERIMKEFLEFKRQQSEKNGN